MIQSKDIELVSIKDIKVNPKNRNKHDNAQIDRLCKIIEYQGFRNPLIVSRRTGLLVAGHGRLEAARKMKLKKVPVMEQDFQDDAQEYACMVSDNAIASWSELDISGINSDIGHLGPDFDLDLLGIKGFEIDGEDPELGDEDSVPNKVDPKSKAGDIYALGNHRLMCGDSTRIDSIDSLMGLNKATITFTSPPYNAAAAPGGSLGHIKYKEAHKDNKEDSEYSDFLCSFLNCAKAISELQIVNLQMLEGGKRGIIDWLYKNKESFLDIAIWNKKTGTPSPESCLTNYCEFLFIFSNEHMPNKRIKTNSFKFASNVYEGENNSYNEFSGVHNAGFPVSFAEHFINLMSKEKDSVFEPFGGTGSTLIACEKTKRKCFMMELDPQYCDIIVARWEKYTGKKAELING